jgi:hypothetical protein
VTARVAGEESPVSPDQLPPPSHYVGRWLRSSSHRDLGYGYCIRAQGSDLIFRFVDIPDVAEHEVLIAREDVIDRPIAPGTRVWVKGIPYGWHAGVAGEHSAAQMYHVSLVGAPPRLRLYQDQFKIRWGRPLEDPSLAVAHGLAEAPTFYEARSALLDELVRQRQVSRGLSAAISAPINLFQHQVDTATRVLADPVMRYLLADEVGLGKTIEAGIVIRQLLIDDPRHRVLVLCPESLCGQWVSELRDRLGILDESMSERVTVAPFAMAPRIAASLQNGLLHFDLVVVDEAHNLLKSLSGNPELEEQLRSVGALLALSATPMRGDSETFRRLLAMVDPVAFADTTGEVFEQRLRERERSAGDVQVLSSRRASVRQKSSVLREVLADYPDDANVSEFAVRCRASSDPHDPVWTDLAEYVKEIYRLSRRMIRHRRTDELVDAYAVAGRSPTFVEVSDPARHIVDDFLETYRQRLLISGKTHEYAMAVLYALAGPAALAEFLSRPSTDEERLLFEMTAARLEMAGVDYRLRRALDLVVERVAQKRRIVVVSTFPSMLNRFTVMLHSIVREGQIHHHYLSMSPEHRDEAVAEFLDGPAGCILLADPSMEEGRNLQLADTLVNLDLPLDINRLDQRIGRLDRYAVRPEPAEVVVFTETSSEWVSSHITLLHRGVGVLDSSVSTVQRVLATLMDTLVEGLLPRGVEALQVDVEALREELEAEREAIDLLEEIESVETATGFPDESFAELLDYEADTEGLRKAMRRLTTGVGALDLAVSESRAGVLTFPSSKGLGLAIDESRALEKLLMPKAFDRSVTLEETGVAPFRIGDPLVSWLQEYVLADERGRASAIVRPAVGIEAATLWLRSEFLIEFDARAVDALRGEGHGIARRGETYLRPLRIGTWTDSDGTAPVDIVEGILDLPFDVKRDEVLRGRCWAPVLEQLPTWSVLCRQAVQSAWEELSASTELAAAIQAGLSNAGRDSARRLAVLEARALRLPTQAERRAAEVELEFERSAAEALIQGIREPSIRMVACGACVLWPEADF